MEKKNKEPYETPVIEVQEVKSEGIICASEKNGRGGGYSGWN